MNCEKCGAEIGENGDCPQCVAKSDAAKSPDLRLLLKRAAIGGGIALVVVAAAVLGLRSGAPATKAAVYPRLLWPRVASVSGSCGLIDQNGKFVVNPQFDRVTRYTDNDWIAVQRGGKWGFIDATGKVKVAPTWEFALPPFNGSLPVIGMNQHAGFIAPDGKVVAPQYLNLPIFDDQGWALVAQGPDPQHVSPRFVDRTGKVVLDLPNYKRVEPFGQSPFAPVLDAATNKWGLVDRQGKVVLTPTYDDIGSFGTAQLAPAKLGDHYTLIDRSMKAIRAADIEAFNLEFIGIGQPARPLFESTSLVPFKRGGKWGYLDATGAEIIAPQFDGANGFVDGNLARAEVGTKWGLIDRSGSFVVNPQFDEIAPFIDGLAAVKSEMKWGFIDSGGKVVIPTQYDGFGYFGGDLIAVQSNGSTDMAWSEQRDTQGHVVQFARNAGSWTYIRRTGELAFPGSFEAAQPFDAQGLAGVQANGKWGFIDTKGQYTVQPQFESLTCGM